MRLKFAYVFSLLLILGVFSTLPSAQALDIPTGLTASGNRGGDYVDGTVTLTWTPVASADNGYAIQTILNGVQVGTLTGALGQSTSRAVVSGLLGGTTYSFKIRAISSSAVSSWSSAVTAMPTTSPSTPVKPTHSTSLLDATVRWSAPPSDGGAGITSYVITEVNSGRTQSVSATTFSAQFNDFASGSKVKFNVRAINGVTTEGTVSANSDETTLPSVPNAVSGVAVAKTSTKDQLRVTWEIPGNGGSVLTGFEVFLRQSGGDVQTIQVTDIQATTTTFNGLAAGTYSAQVLAKNVIGSGARSTEPTGVDIEGVTPAVAASSSGSSGGSGGGFSGGGGGGGGGGAPSPSASPSPSPSASPSPSPSTSPSAAATPTPSASRSPTPSPLATPTPKVTTKAVPTISKSASIGVSLPKSINPKGVTTKILDSKGNVIKGVKVTISSKGKLTIIFPKGSKVGAYSIKVKTKNNKTINFPIKIKK
jgi:uncharacterized protein (DUF2141 family)